MVGKYAPSVEQSSPKIKTQNCARKPNSVFAVAHEAQRRRQSFLCAAHPKALSQRLIRRATCQTVAVDAFLHRLASGRLASRLYRYKRGWALTPPFHPYLAFWARRSAFCCALCRARIAPARLNLCSAEALPCSAPCSVMFGLSSMRTSRIAIASAQFCGLKVTHFRSVRCDYSSQMKS